MTLCLIVQSFCTPGRSEFYRVVRERVWKEVVAPRVGAGGSARGVPAWHIAAGALGPPVLPRLYEGGCILARMTAPACIRAV